MNDDMDLNLVRCLARPADVNVVLPVKPGGARELEAAVALHLDELARAGTGGLIEPADGKE